MDVRKQWMSQNNGCHKAMDVTEQWMSQSNGCHRAIDAEVMDVFSAYLK